MSENPLITHWALFVIRDRQRSSLGLQNPWLSANLHREKKKKVGVVSFRNRHLLSVYLRTLSPVETLPVQSNDNPRVEQTSVVLFEFPHVLVLRVGHVAAEAHKGTPKQIPCNTVNY